MEDQKKKGEWDEWKDIGKRIEELVKQEIKQVAKTGEPQNWKETGKKIEAKVRSQMAKAAGAHPEANWVELGKQTEDRVRASIGKWAGADKNDDWMTIGKKADARIREQVANVTGAESDSDWLDIGKKFGNKIKSKVNDWLEDDEKTKLKRLNQLSEPYRGWNYYPDFVVQPNPRDNLNFTSIDCPLVWKLGDQWQMWYTGFDGRGYQTALAVSNDLINWELKGLVMGFGKEDAFDYGGVTFGGVLFDSYDIKSPRTLKKWNNKYWVLYGCYPKQG